MFGFNVNKLKPNLKMAVHRIGIVKNKKANAALAQRLRGCWQTAKRRRRASDVGYISPDANWRELLLFQVEGIILDDFTMEGYEILELMCVLLAERAVRSTAFLMIFAALMETFSTVHTTCVRPCTFIWSASRTDIPEFREVKKQLTKKSGQVFEATAVLNMDGCVNERVIQKLSVQPPSAFLVVN
ncbi:hypothetical protein PsorP6_019316 [Peronosclerospora sorghi]|nr:hypothetical protein PsorP6_019316 [Peronosclerospora sorghi]